MSEQKPDAERYKELYSVVCDLGAFVDAGSEAHEDVNFSLANIALLSTDWLQSRRHNPATGVTAVVVVQGGEAV
jgi:hypothetical protein